MADSKSRQYGGLDYFKIMAALLVVAVHTSPLSSLSDGADFFLTRVIARVAVPFFLMVSGFFILPPYLFEKSVDARALWRFIRKTAVLYGIAMLIYLPIGIYAGLYKQLDALSIFRMIVFDGIFYHLWYLPASIIGSLLLYFLGRKLPFWGVLAISAALYVIGLFGDSYFGLISEMPVVASLYDAGFQIFSFTRNGIFYAPVFLAMGAYLGRSQRMIKRKASLAGFLVCMIIMVVEGLALHHYGLQRHDSMYIALLPCMYFLFQFVLSWNIKPAKSLRTVSIWIYLIHPLFIVAVRGAIKITGLTGAPAENSLIRYLAVCALSIIFALLISRLPVYKEASFQKGRAWIELDRNALRHNVMVLRAKLPEGCELMPAVKANAYGHGAVLISRELNAMGVKAFCVASVLEGVELRRGGIKGEILIFGYTHPQQFHLLRRYHLAQTAIDCAYATKLNTYGKKMKVHIGIDTGMHRLGERCERIDEISGIFRLKNLRIEGIYSHLCADDTVYQKDIDFTLTQGKALKGVVSQLKERGCVCPKTHLLSSYGLLNYPELSGDYARVGIALYGMLSTREDTEKCAADLRPVLSVKARVAAVKALVKGEAAGYGLTFVAERDTTIAALTIGYADGLPRSLSCGAGKVLINGCEAPIIGRICMDQTLVEVTDIPEVQSGDIAVVIGRSGEEDISACDLAEHAETISNEILSRLGKRLERELV